MINAIISNANTDLQVHANILVNFLLMQIISYSSQPYLLDLTENISYLIFTILSQYDDKENSLS